MGIAKALIFVLVPGGYWFAGRRYLLGAGAFVLWLVAAETLVVSSVAGLEVGFRWRELAWGVAVGLYVANFALSLVYVLRRRGGGVQQQRKELYCAALEAFLAGDDAKAGKELMKLRKIDPLDPDGLFLEAEVALAAGRERRAKSLFRRCRDFDEEGKWEWEIECALERL